MASETITTENENKTKELVSYCDKFQRNLLDIYPSFSYVPRKRIYKRPQNDQCYDLELVVRHFNSCKPYEYFKIVQTDERVYFTEMKVIAKLVIVYNATLKHYYRSRGTKREVSPDDLGLTCERENMCLIGKPIFPNTGR